ncbi:MAG TPA: diacylglycerol kinase family protein [Gemmatimonadaceae bacterium]|nr:diacylglycerol kinase family protein [Gemmatimonadaceae bacterium]
MAVLSGPVLLVVNPGARRAARLAGVAAGELRAQGLRCELLETTGPGHAAATLRAEPERWAAVFTLGGDGTVMEVLGALRGGSVPVGVLPAGTGNLIARAFGIPLGVRRAVRVLARGDVARIDLGQLGGGRCFAFAAGVGVDAYMIANTPPHWKRRYGVLAYAIAAGRGVLTHAPFHVRAVVDGQLIERTATAVMLANFGSVLNRLVTLGPGIRQDDGRLDLCVFSPASAGQGARLMWRLFRGDFRPAPDVLWVPGRCFEIATDPPLPAQADGDLLGVTPFTAEVLPLAACLLVPSAVP